MSELKDYASILPKEPPKKLLKTLIKEGYFKENYLVYRSEYVLNPLTEQKEKMVKCRCSNCKETFYEDYCNADCCFKSYVSAPFGFHNSITNEPVISYNDTLCPNCGAKVKVYHCGAFKNYNTVENRFPMSVHKIKGRLVLICWCFTRRIDKNANDEIYSRPYEAYIVDGKKMVKCVGYTRFMSSLSWHDWEQRKRCDDSFGKLEFLYLCNKEDIYKTSAANSHLYKYIEDSYAAGKKAYPVTYLRVWQRHNNVENIVVQGGTPLLCDLLNKNMNCYGYYGQNKRPSTDLKGIDWKQNKPSKMLGLNKTDFRYCVDNRWNFEQLEFYKEAIKVDKKFEPSLVKKITGKFNLYDVKYLFACTFDGNLSKTVNYIFKQYKLNKKQVSFLYYHDYLDMLVQLGFSKTDPALQFPNDLVASHNQMVLRLQEKEDEELKKSFAKRFKELSKFSFKYKGLKIVPCKNQKELNKEGKELNHCVSRYAKQHASGETAIFFIRKTENPDKSYFTLELDEKAGRVRQNRGNRNCERTVDVKEFEKEFVKFVKQVLITERKTKNVREKEKHNRSRSA